MATTAGAAPDSLAISRSTAQTKRQLKGDELDKEVKIKLDIYTWTVNATERGLAGSILRPAATDTDTFLLQARYAGEVRRRTGGGAFSSCIPFPQVCWQISIVQDELNKTDLDIKGTAQSFSMTMLSPWWSALRVLAVGPNGYT